MISSHHTNAARILYFPRLMVRLTTALHPHRRKAQGCGGKDFVDGGHGHNFKRVSVTGGEDYFPISVFLFRHGWFILLCRFFSLLLEFYNYDRESSE